MYEYDKMLMMKEEYESYSLISIKDKQSCIEIQDKCSG